MSTLFAILAFIAMIAVVVILVSGLVNLARGGSPHTSNRLMQARVAMQAVAIVLLVIALFVLGGF
jgi:cytochrome b subunit of formate dehydrogenase